MAELVGLEFLKKNEIKGKPCDPTRPYAFISYSHDPNDAQIVMNVFKVLYNKGYNLWIDIANMPYNEIAWNECAFNALINESCSFAFFFRSESSMSKETIAEELDLIKTFDHIESIVTVDIWHEPENTAKKCRKKILNSGNRKIANICLNICKIVSPDNSAIRLAEDVKNNIPMLAESMEEELQRLGVLPVQRGDGPDTGLETTLTKKAEPKPQVLELSATVELTAVKKQEASPETTEPPEVPCGTETITLPDFLKKYNISTFKKETFQQVRLVGSGEYAKYSTPSFDSVYPVVWSFVMKLLEERGEAYLHFVNGKNPGSKNPPFITAAEHKKRKEEKHPITYRRLELPGLEGWSMCRHYGQYDWVSNVLRKRMKELGLPLEAFSFEYVDPGQAQQKAVFSEPETPVKTEASSGTEEPAKPSVSTGGIKGPATLLGEKPKKQKQAAPADGYSFTLFGEQYKDMILKNMMLTVFKTILNRHPDKLDQLLEKLPCLKEGIKISYDAKPTTFRAGEEIEINGRSIAIGTSLNKEQVLSYIGRLMSLCGEPKENLVIDGYDY